MCLIAKGFLVPVNSYNNIRHDIAEELLKLAIHPNRSKICIYLLFAKEFLIKEYNFGQVYYSFHSEFVTIQKSERNFFFKIDYFCICSKL